MGATLSHQEELFLHRQWAELLQAAMAADLETPATEAALPVSRAENGNDGAHGAATSANSPTTSKVKKTKKKDEFCMSFQEWQALLSIAEQSEASSVPSDVAARLTTAQLHVPAVSLTVHVCAWWRGTITTAQLDERLQQLTSLVNEIQRSHTHSTTEGTEDGGSDEAPAQIESDAAPASRRAHLARFVHKVVDHAKHLPASTAPSDAANGNSQLRLDAFADLTCLVQELLAQQQLSSSLHTGDGPLRKSTSHSVGCAPATSKQAQEVFELYDEKIRNGDILKQRPVLAVVMVLVLAVFAAKHASQPQLAVRSVAHLEALEGLLFGSGSAGTSRPKLDAPPPPATTTTTTPSPLAALWPLVGELEVALVHRQHEADVACCLSSEGDALIDTLRQMREQREALQSMAGNDATAAPSAGERWSAEASQYIGQRPIWRQLRSHFLSAGVFDADKPTVLVFFGPSGYGKSELAKRVASVLHNCPVSELESSGKMVYIHMPSFCTKDSIYSLVDPPAAHVGSGILISALQKQPDAVVVLDEFEKSTAESINNLWLSAFQKDGVLRSLKEASRSVSTVRTTFILTCNIAADAIAKREDLYLSSSAADQETIRNLFVTQCKDVCRETMGDPFVNRVDYFFPFMPYTCAERRQFVCLLLERLLASQAKKKRRLYVTPAFVKSMVARLHTFHAATLEEAVRSQVMGMVQAGWSSAVLTVERRITGEVIVLLPTTATAAAAADDDNNNSNSNSSNAHSSLVVEAWNSLPGGTAALQKWGEVSSPEQASTTASSPTSPLQPMMTAKAKARAGVQESKVRSTVDLSAQMSAAPPQKVERSPDSPHLEKQYEHECTMDKARIMELEQELEKTRDLVKQRDLEIVTLKEKVLLLQKALAVVMLALMSCLCLITVVIGLKLTILFAVAMTTVVVLVLGVPPALLLKAVQALFRELGPIKGGVLVLLAALWLARASKSIVSCS